MIPNPVEPPRRHREALKAPRRSRNNVEDLALDCFAALAMTAAV
jgi:hypothetical protein